MIFKSIIEDFQVAPGYHCLYSSLYNILHYMNIPLTEEEIFILCDGLTFQIQLEDNRSFFDYILDSIRVDYTNQVQTLCSRINIQNKIFNDFSSLYQVLKNKSPVLAFVKAQALKYNIVENPRENLGAHGVAVYGIDMERQIIYIADSYLLDYNNQVHTGMFPINIADFKNSLISFCAFFVNGYTFDRRMILKSYSDSIDQYFNPVWNNGEQAALYIVENLKLWNKGSERAPAHQNNYITLIFLLKAYFMNILDYIQKLNTRYLQEFVESDTMVSQIQKNMNGFFLRCLSKIGSDTDDKYVVESGKKSINLYSNLLRKTRSRVIGKYKKYIVQEESHESFRTNG